MTRQRMTRLEMLRCQAPLALRTTPYKIRIHTQSYA